MSEDSNENIEISNSVWVDSNSQVLTGNSEIIYEKEGINNSINYLLAKKSYNQIPSLSKNF